MKLASKHPELTVAIASGAWGLFWIPLRAFERNGLPPTWATLTQFLAPLLVLLPFAVWRWWNNQPTGIAQYRSGILIGTGVAMYVESLLLTDVARALILFYVMPAWGTLLEIGVMKQKLTRWRGASLALSIAGLLIILGAGESFSIALSLGDLLALLSGMLFALGALQVRLDPHDPSVAEDLFAFFFYGSLAALVFSFLPLIEFEVAPTVADWLGFAPWLLLVSVGFLIPVMWGIYWGSRRVDPGRLGILLQLEALVGIGSAALFAGEPFGWTQAIGAALVISAGFLEVIGNR